eukprot:TRINITY_DN17_c0_g1_i1.p1 TRINITY_DN17_c0_g1~~TRINITY_DN17_c0_g1_i1.p1  ORF type:complete len:811 (+),score=189.08 TRINITY_DN17_c0_g1_i1:114-2546(+)
MVRRRREVRYDFVIGETDLGRKAESSDDSADDADEDAGEVAAMPIQQVERERRPGVTFSQDATKMTVQCLRRKGFALIGLGEEHKATIDAARLEGLQLLQENGGNNFRPPPAIIADGLLGEEGSAEIMDLDGYTFEKHGKTGLAQADMLLSELSNSLATMDAALETNIDSRTPLIFHNAGIPLDSDVPDLTPAACQKWLNVLGHSRLMLILFLGPGFGRLELQPLDIDEIEPREVDVGPGTLVVLRVDALLHRFYSTARSLSLTCFLMEDVSATWRRRYGIPAVATPVCHDLMDWATERLEKSRKSQTIGAEGQVPDLEMPRQWQRMANQIYQVGPQVAVRGTSCKFPSSYSDSGWWCGMQAGCDLVEEVPLCRWDHQDFYDADPESWKWGKTDCMHASFIDGVELFDNKFFGISPVESRGMDPCQRHILETSYEALHFSAFTKKSLLRSLIGVYIGAASSEFNFMPQTCSSTGTGAANSITSNRISFCLGLQGPSFTADAQGASALSSLTSAAMSLRLQTDTYKPNHAAVVGAAYLMITGTTWIIASGRGWLSPQGRCFTFDNSAEGYVKSEGVSSLVLNLLEEQVDGKKVRDDSSTVNGVIAATHMNHTGRGATLTASCGPQEQELIMSAVRQAAIAPSTVDAVECWSHGNYLQDAAEVEVLKCTLRGHSENEAPLMLSTGFTASGMAMECAGMAQLLKVLVNHKYGAVTPSLHLHQLNVHIDSPDDSEQVLFATEDLLIEGLSSYCGITSKSMGGTMCHCVTLGNLQTMHIQKSAEPELEENAERRRLATREAQKLACSDFWTQRHF